MAMRRSVVAKHLQGPHDPDSCRIQTRESLSASSAAACHRRHALAWSKLYKSTASGTTTRASATAARVHCRDSLHVECSAISVIQNDRHSQNAALNRTACAPLALMGTRIMDCCRWVAALGSDLPMKMATAQRGSQAPVVHHFLPCSKYSSPLHLSSNDQLCAQCEATTSRRIWRTKSRDHSEGT